MTLLFGASAATAQTPQPSGQVSVSTTVKVYPVYDFYASGSGEVDVSVNGTSLQVASNQPVELLTSFRPASVLATATVNGTATELQVTVTSGHFGTLYAYDFTLPERSTGLSVEIVGLVGGSGFLWKYIAGIPSVQLQGWSVPVSYSTQMLIPQGNKIAGLYGNYGHPLPESAIQSLGVSNGDLNYRASSDLTTLIVESDLFPPAATFVTIAGLVVVAMAAFGIFSPGKRLYSRVVSAARRTKPSGLKFPFRLRALFRPKTLLVLFFTCAIFMVALGVAGGPDPRVKAYVIASPNSVGPIQAQLAAVTGEVSVLTPAQDYTDFGTMSAVGEFTVVVVSSYPALALPPVSQYVLPSLGNVPVIIVDRTADPTFVAQISTLYGSNVISVQNASSLSSTETQQIRSVIAPEIRSNFVGLQLGISQFKAILATEGVLSFVLIFLGWAYLGSLISDASFESTLFHLVSVLAAGLFVFFFSEVVYVEVSSLLAFPLSLHAVISGARDVTAVGLLGFGGGSTPRLAAGFVGVIVGALATEERPPINKRDLALVLGIPAMLLVDPFLLGNFAYEAVLLFASPYAIGTAYVSSLSFKGFIYSVGAALGGGNSPTYLMSAGKMLYFAGLVPLAYLRKMGKTTMAFALVVSAFIVGDGGVRVGEMTPDKTVIAAIPGLATGFAIVAVLLGVAAVEKYLRRQK